MESETLNIVKLIERNPITRLNKTYGDKIVNKIKNTFTEKEQQIFLGSFYCFLNYNSKTDFVIDFDQVWKWTGFTRGDNARRVLTKHFIIDIDYKVENFAPQVGGAKNNIEEQGKNDDSKDNRGGSNKENIKLNINTFKKFCLKANTKKADEIHDYYIKLEELLQETINEQTIELEEQLKIKNKEYKKLEQKVSIRDTCFRKGDVIYVGKNECETDAFKVGISDNLNGRGGTLSTGTTTDFIFEKHWYTRFSREIEDAVKKNFAQERKLLRKEFYDINYYDEILEYIEKLVKVFNDLDRKSKQEPVIVIEEEDEKDEYLQKKCTKCLNIRPLSQFYKREHFDEDETIENLKIYRSRCIPCHSRDVKELKEQIMLNPNYGKKECKCCRLYFKVDMFFLDTNNNCLDNCKECYKKTNKLEACKQCNKCKKITGYEHFHKDHTKNDGYHSACKDCRNAAEIERRSKLEKKDLTCEFCDKYFTRREYLTNHQRNTLSCKVKQGITIDVKKKTSARAKKVEQIDYKTNKIIATFSSVTEACKETEIGKKRISDCCNGKRDEVEGYIFRFV